MSKLNSCHCSDISENFTKVDVKYKNLCGIMRSSIRWDCFMYTLPEGQKLKIVKPTISVLQEVINWFIQNMKD